MSRLRFVLMLLCCYLLGCASLHDNAVRTANSTADFLDGAQGAMEGSYEREQLGCVERAATKAESKACREASKRRWAPAWAGYDAVRSTWLALAATIETADASGSELDPAEVLTLLGKLAQAVKDFKALHAAATVQEPPQPRAPPDVPAPAPPPEPASQPVSAPPAPEKAGDDGSAGAP